VLEREVKELISVDPEAQEVVNLPVAPLHGLICSLGVAKVVVAYWSFLEVESMVMVVVD
jgi:hypothetical protein